MLRVIGRLPPETPPPSVRGRHPRTLNITGSSQPHSITSSAHRYVQRQLVEFTPRMCPAGGEPHRAARSRPLEAGTAIDLQGTVDATEKGDDHGTAAAAGYINCVRRSIFTRPLRSTGQLRGDDCQIRNFFQRSAARSQWFWCSGGPCRGFALLKAAVRCSVNSKSH